MLPQSTILGKLEMVEVYDYVDRPVLFVCKNESWQPFWENYFLAVLVEDNEEGETWFYVRISGHRYEQLRFKEVDLHTAFKYPEIGVVAEVIIPTNGPILVNDLMGCSINDSRLPARGEFLTRKDETP